MADDLTADTESGFRLHVGEPPLPWLPLRCGEGDEGERHTALPYTHWEAALKMDFYTKGNTSPVAPMSLRRERRILLTLLLKYLVGGG